MQYTTNSNEETFALAQNLAKELKGGDVIGLVGDLGAGKTVFSQGLAAGLEVKEQVTSPTFVVMKVYDCNSHPTIKHLCHIDAYRLRGEADLLALGADDYLGEPSTLTVIEWADKVPALLPKGAKTINIEIRDSQRNIEIG
jgi:tRNA threonylcarbamoyladenosine biosynthesis protein TsaE